jgi:bifunctional non-homologous end joining protein LigD
MELVIDRRKIEITHPDKLIWQEQGIKKIDYIHYLLQVSP